MRSSSTELVSNFESINLRWFITGVGGFIGSHILEALVGLGQEVVGLDNFSTGKQENIDQALAAASHSNKGHKAASKFRLIRADINDVEAVYEGLSGNDVCLHQAALGSVPRSLEDPMGTNLANVSGFLNVLWNAQKCGVSRFVYASSSSVYGDEEQLPKIEERIGLPLSPYAASKLIDEIYAGVFSRQFGISCVGLRYFNVFGPRQDPLGPYAAVIPKWISVLKDGGRATLYGDGSSSRDFCYVENVVYANLRAALANEQGVFNIGLGGNLTLLELYRLIASELRSELKVSIAENPIFKDFRPGDVMHSQADISRARKLIGFEPIVSVAEGIARTVKCFCTFEG